MFDLEKVSCFSAHGAYGANCRSKLVYNGKRHFGKLVWNCLNKIFPDELYFRRRNRKIGKILKGKLSAEELVDSWSVLPVLILSVF